jgi:hypothetical protein
MSDEFDLEINTTVDLKVIGNEGLVGGRYRYDYEYLDCINGEEYLTS